MECPFLQRAIDSNRLQSANTDSVAHLAPTQEAPKGSFYRRKRESDHWPPPSAQIQKAWSCASTILYAFTAYQRTTFHSHRWWKWPFHSEGTSKLKSIQAQCWTTATTQQAQHVELCPLACTQHRDVRACSSRREWHMAIAIVGCQVAGPTCSTFLEKGTLQLLLWRSSSCIRDQYDIWLRMCIK